MSPATLYREGTDLDDLLSDLDQQYPGQVRVVEIARPREGGVLGFFAKQRVGVHYQLIEQGRGGAPVSDRAASKYDDMLGDGYAPGREELVPGEEYALGGSGFAGSEEYPVQHDEDFPFVGDDLFAPSHQPASGAQFAQVLAELAVRKASRTAELAVEAESPRSAIARRYDAVRPSASDSPSAADAVAVSDDADVPGSTGSNPDFADVRSGAGTPAPLGETATPDERLARAYAIIQAHAESTATDIANELASDPTSGFVPAPLPRAVPAPRRTAEDTEPALPAGRRRPRAVPRFQPLDSAGAESAPDVNAPHPVVFPTATVPATAAPAVEDPAASARMPGLPWSFPAVSGEVAPAGGPAIDSAASTEQLRDAADPEVATPAIPAAAEWTIPTQLRHQLAALGVAEGRIPGNARHAFAAIEELTQALPSAPVPPTGRDTVIVVAGRARDAAFAADALLTAAGGAITDVWSYGCPTGSGRTVSADHVITSVAQAGEVITGLRQSATGAVLVIVGTDGSAWTNRPGEIIDALQADTVWAVVEATAKPADAATALRRLGPVDAIVVSGAEHSSSPATVWDFDLPIALLDGHPATAQAWAVLLMGKLTDMERTCSDARC